MLSSRKSLVCLGSIALSSSLHPGAVEEAALQVTVNPGALEIAPSSVNGPFTPAHGAVGLTGADQADAVTFQIAAIQINDLNGDGQGWRITATPSVLSKGAHALPVGSVVGFTNASDPDHTTIESPTSALFSSGAGTSNYTIDFEVAYDLPAYSAAGEYTGSIAFTIVAE